MGSCSSKKDDNIDSVDKTPSNGGTTSQSNGKRKDVQNPNPLNGKGSSNITYQSQSSSNNENVIYSARAEVNYLLARINEFQGITEDDKNYRYLDEMLTRCILKLDNIECNNTTDRSNRKEAIRDINQAISILERKLEINFDLKELESNLAEM